MSLSVNISSPFKLLISLAVFSSLLSCQSSFLQPIQSVTYKPDFHYISHLKWASSMRKMEVYTSMLTRNLGTNQGMNDDQRASSLSLLKKLDQLSLDLSLETLNTHQDFTLFRQGIATAREGLLQTPANYSQIAVISSYCTNCHSKAER